MKVKVKAKKAKTAKPEREPKLSRTHAPPDLSPVEWQRALRRQFGRDQTFGLENIGTEPIFSEFRVANPESKSSYHVAIRGQRPGDNFCACPDFATNELGTCKHIEFTLARLSRKRGARAAFARGYQPVFSELYLRNDGERAIHFRAGTDCPAKVKTAAALLFDEAAAWRLPAAHFDALSGFLSSVAGIGHELRAYDDALEHVAGRRDAVRRDATLTRFFPCGADDPQFRKLLKVPLYRYQAEGALFAVRAGRALIGDEMGLGKTDRKSTRLNSSHLRLSRMPSSA